MKNKDKAGYFFLALFPIFILNEYLILPKFSWLGFIESIFKYLILFIIFISGVIILILLFMKNSKAFSIKPRIILAVSIIVLLGSSTLVIREVVYYAPDISNLVTLNHSIIIGYPVNIKISKGKSSYQQFSIDGMDFKVSPANTFQDVGLGKYKVTYLPYSKYVLNIEKIIE